MSDEIYGVEIERVAMRVAAPDLPYGPPVPRDAGALPIGLIGCGGITQSHLAAYRAAGFRVTALASRSRERAEARRAEFFPGAEIYADWRELLARDDVRVVDVATHAAVRPPIVEAGEPACLDATQPRPGLSQRRIRDCSRIVHE